MNIYCTYFTLNFKIYFFSSSKCIKESFVEIILYVLTVEEKVGYMKI